MLISLGNLGKPEEGIKNNHYTKYHIQELHT